MSNISVTIIGILTIILSNYMPTEEVDTVMQAVGIIIAWYGRFRQGDINILGVKQ